jgi:hypothetical protein
MTRFQQIAKDLNGFFAEFNGESVATALDDRVEIHLVPETKISDIMCVQMYRKAFGLYVTVNGAGTRLTVW